MRPRSRIGKQLEELKMGESAEYRAVYIHIFCRSLPSCIDERPSLGPFLSVSCLIIIIIVTLCYEHGVF